MIKSRITFVDACENIIITTLSLSPSFSASTSNYLSFPVSFSISFSFSILLSLLSFLLPFYSRPFCLYPYSSPLCLATLKIVFIFLLLTLARSYVLPPSLTFSLVSSTLLILKTSPLSLSLSWLYSFLSYSSFVSLNFSLSFSESLCFFFFLNIFPPNNHISSSELWTQKSSCCGWPLKFFLFNKVCFLCFDNNIAAAADEAADDDDDVNDGVNDDNDANVEAEAFPTPKGDL